MIPLGDDNSQRLHPPFVTIALIIVNAFVFFLEFGQGSDAHLQMFFQKWCVVPREYALRTDLPPYIPVPFWFTLFTSMFMHGGWMHIIGNMLYLYIFGDNVEDHWGHLRFFVIYILCGIAASLSFIAFNLHSTLPSLGASGAIAGILGAYLVLFPKNQVRVLVFRFFTTLPAYVVLGFWIVLQFISQIGEIGHTAETSGVAYMAHIGGFITGVIFALIVGRRPGTSQL